MVGADIVGCVVRVEVVFPKLATSNKMGTVTAMSVASRTKSVVESVDSALCWRIPLTYTL
jgi:hypothetical protein